MHKITFFPLCRQGAQPANAETFRIDLHNGRKILADYADTRDSTDKWDLRCDLPTLLKRDLNGRNYYDVVMFTHLDDDHVRGAGNFFWFERFSDRQSDDRIKINELWVPAAAIVDTKVDGDAELIRAEARHRLRQKKNIKVFSAPDTLADWCKKENLDLDELKRLKIVIDAGKVVPTFATSSDGVEFFVHSPFATRTDDGRRIERNKDAIVLQAKFTIDGAETKFLITADVSYHELEEIVRMTRLRNNEDRLAWDVIDISHHCSYTGIGPDKGVDKTKPTAGIKWLHEQGLPGGILVSSSCIIPTIDTDQPPHRQAAAHYKDVAHDIGNGQFIATMEHPSKSKPEPLVIEITVKKAALQRLAISTSGAAALTTSAPRVGIDLQDHQSW